MVFTEPYSEIHVAGIGPILVLPQFGGYSTVNDRRNPGVAQFIDSARRAQSIFDVGAHVGLYTLPAARVAPQNSRIVAFEASPVNSAILTQHVELNGCAQVQIVQQVIGEAGRQSMFSLVSNGFGDLNTLAVSPTVAARFSSEASAVTEQSLDAYVELLGFGPDLLKIDVEGAELRVLRGAGQLLSRFRPRIFLSVHPEEIELLGGSLGELTAVITDAGYHILAMSGERVKSLEFGEYRLEPEEPGKTFL